MAAHAAKFPPRVSLGRDRAGSRRALPRRFPAMNAAPPAYPIQARPQYTTIRPSRIIPSRTSGTTFSKASLASRPLGSPAYSPVVSAMRMSSSRVMPGTFPTTSYMEISWTAGLGAPLLRPPAERGSGLTVRNMGDCRETGSRLSTERTARHRDAAQYSLPECLSNRLPTFYPEV